jgi:predicted RNA-binding protein with PUA-like domain
MKSEPSSYSIDDLERDTRTPWEGVRNYQARNFMRDDMRVGDRVFFYHSACASPGITGLARVCSRAYPDPTARKRGGKYYDPKASDTDPRWYLVDVCFEKKLKNPLSLRDMREDAHLTNIPLLRRGNRLSVLPLGEGEGSYLLRSLT